MAESAASRLIFVLATLAALQMSTTLVRAQYSLPRTLAVRDENVRSAPDEAPWVLRSQYDGAPRNHPITFALSGVGYLMTGVEEVFDMFTYNATADRWTRVNTDEFQDALPEWRTYSYGVAAGDKAFLGLGLGPETEDSGWSIFVGSGGGLAGNLRDWWEYSVNEDTWTQRSDLPGPARHHPYYWDARVGDKHYAYVGFGHGDAAYGRIFRDVYRYDPDEQSWARMRDFPGEPRVAGTQFTLFDSSTGRDRPFILSGDGSDHSFMDTGELWEYLPATDEWIEHRPHPGSSRWAPGSFVLGCEVFLTSGYDRSTGIMHKDMMSHRLC